MIFILESARSALAVETGRALAELGYGKTGPWLCIISFSFKNLIYSSQTSFAHGSL
jgi:hypothetical protein